MLASATILGINDIGRIRWWLTVGQTLFNSGITKLQKHTHTSYKQQTDNKKRNG